MNNCEHEMEFVDFSKNEIDCYIYDLWRCEKCGKPEIRNKRSLPRRDPEGGATD